MDVWGHWPNRGKRAAKLKIPQRLHSWKRQGQNNVICQPDMAKINTVFSQKQALLHDDQLMYTKTKDRIQNMKPYQPERFIKVMKPFIGKALKCARIHKKQKLQSIQKFFL